MLRLGSDLGVATADLHRMLLAAEFEPMAVFAALLGSLVRLSNAQMAAYFRREDGSWRLVLVQGLEEACAYPCTGAPLVPAGALAEVDGGEPTPDAIEGSLACAFIGSPATGSLASQVGYIRGANDAIEGALVVCRSEPFEPAAVTPILAVLVGVAGLILRREHDAIEHRRLREELAAETSRRERTEGHIRLLKAELNHRVKNTLSTIQGLITQTLRSTPDPFRFVEGTLGRIQGLAANHALLTDTNWSGASLRAIVERTMGLFRGRLGGEPWTIQGPDMWIQASASTTIGMILFELAQNAARYGALRQPDGRVLIGWTIEGEADDAVLRLIWTEVGSVRLPGAIRPGFGTRMIQQVSRQFAGTVVITHEGEERTCALAIPVARIAGSPEDRGLFEPARRAA